MWMLAPIILIELTCLDSCSYYGAKLIETGRYDCICIDEAGEFQTVPYKSTKEDTIQDGGK